MQLNKNVDHATPTFKLEKAESIADRSTTIMVELLAVSLGPFPDSAQQPLCQALYLPGSLCGELYCLEMPRVV